MLMPTNTFKQAIVSGKPQIGLWISLSSAFAAEVVASAGYDWVLLDMEHSPSAAAKVVTGMGKPVGTLVSNPQKAIELLNSGFSFVACGTDAGLLARGADSLLQTVRDGIG